MGQLSAVPTGARAIDGDTVAFSEQNKPNLQLVGCDAPEIRRADCEAEKTLGRQAKDFLQQAIDTGKLDVQYVRCSCKPGTEGTKDCNMGRDCGIVLLDWRNICDAMIAKGLAKRFLCGKTSCPDMPNWCE